MNSASVRFTGSGDGNRQYPRSWSAAEISEYISWVSEPGTEEDVFKRDGSGEMQAKDIYCKRPEIDRGGKEPFPVLKRYMIIRNILIGFMETVLRDAILKVINTLPISFSRGGNREDVE